MSLPAGLERGRRKIESFMVDVCEIFDPGDGIAEDTFDTVTLEWTHAARDRLYGRWVKPHGGMCTIKKQTSQGQTQEHRQGEATVADERWEAKIPLSAPTIPEGSVLVVTTSQRDDDLPGRTFRVTEVGGGTMATSRKLTLERLAPTVPQEAQRP